MSLYGAVPWLYIFWRFISFRLNLNHTFFRLNYYVCVVPYCIVLFYVVLCNRREWNGLWSRLTVEKTTQRKLLRSLSKHNTTQSILYIIIWFTSVFSISLLISLFVLSHLSFLSFLIFPSFLLSSFYLVYLLFLRYFLLYFLITNLLIPSIFIFNIVICYSSFLAFLSIFLHFIVLCAFLFFYLNRNYANSKIFVE